jgi:hypothetical protein
VGVSSVVAVGHDGDKRVADREPDRGVRVLARNSQGETGRC